MDSSLAVEHWKTVAAETACLGEGEAEMFSREINSPMQLRRPSQQKPVFPGCCINSSTFKHRPAACLCGSFQFVYYTTYLEMQLPAFFFFFSWNFTPIRHCCQNNPGTNIYPTHFHCYGKPKNGPQLCASFLHDSALFSVLSLVSWASASCRELHREQNDGEVCARRSLLSFL